MALTVPRITIQNMTMAYGNFVIQRNLVTGMSAGAVKG